MRLKSYFSGTVEAALELARKELGPEALLVNARPAGPETRHLGAYEVVLGVLPEEPPAAAGTAQLREELAELRRKIERLSPAAAPPPLPATRQGAGWPAVDPGLGVAGAGRAIVALAGPPGSGKTTTLIKLAARYGLVQRKPPLILTADVYRIGAAEQLRTMAAILGIACEVAQTPRMLAQLLEEHHAKDLVLIDTPGFGRAEMDAAAELADVLASHKEIDTHLVLPASMNPPDLRRTADDYAVFAPSKLLFTRLDEACSRAAAEAEAAHRNLPVSFLGTGQSIPEDLEEAGRLPEPRAVGAAA